MEAKKDIKTGIIRHTYGTVYPAECKRAIVDSGFVRKSSVNGIEVSPKELESTAEVIFDVEFEGEVFNVISTGTRTIIVGMHDNKMIKLFKAIGGEDWEYDNLSERNDFV